MAGLLWVLVGEIRGAARLRAAEVLLPGVLWDPTVTGVTGVRLARRGQVRRAVSTGGYTQPGRGRHSSACGCWLGGGYTQLSRCRYSFCAGMRRRDEPSRLVILTLVDLDEPDAPGRLIKQDKVRRERVRKRPRIRPEGRQGVARRVARAYASRPSRVERVSAS